jgi:integrase/recombinase XerD
MWGKGVTVKFIIDSELVLLRAPEGPLAAYIKRFAESLSEQGYTLDSIHRQVFIAACFSQWLKR